MQIDYTPLTDRLTGTKLESWAHSLCGILDGVFDPSQHGDLTRWREALEALPDIAISSINLNAGAVSAGNSGSGGSVARTLLRETLAKLHPWRKGPFEVCGVHIDTEWRSDWKWDRLKHSIEPLEGRTVLDVGCGNGYHCWRMTGAGANLVIGIEPMLLYVMQYWALGKYLDHNSTWVLPLRMEELPPGLRAFDTVFSMGVLYHRRSPMDHMLELKNALRPGGQLVLETLVTDGGPNQVLVPQGRYARMRNVWFVPSSQALIKWLEKLNFYNIKLVDESPTTIEEQRSTEWMRFESLSNCLDPDDNNLTVEGHPAPKRSIIIATST